MRKAALALVLVFMSACTTVPITGRSQLNMVSDEAMVTAADASFSKFMGAVRKKNAELSPQESVQSRSVLESVQRVSDRVIEASGMRRQHNWQTVVVKAKEPNAFVMPNGKIVVFTGLLPVVKNEAGLAAVLGHEVGHVMARHQAERMSQTLLAQIAVATVDVALAVAEPKYQPVVGAALGIGAQYGVLLPFSRAHESEADRIGVILMAKAGYDPAEAINVWERMERMAGGGQWEFMSTHPSPQTRRANIRSWLAEANLYYADRLRPLPANLAELKLATAAHDKQMSLAPTALRPTLSVGFWETSQISNQAAKVTSRLERIESCSIGQCLVYRADTGRKTVQTPDFGVAEIRYPNGTSVQFSPPLPMIQWPLRVGNSWTQDTTVDHSTQGRRSLQVKGTVVSYESVSVPAGSFMAFKIVMSLSGRRFSELWYSPETRTIVRSVNFDTRGTEVVTELVDYRRAVDDGGGPSESDTGRRP
jgi:Zn-dependent protease with chaperone function